MPELVVSAPGERHLLARALLGPAAPSSVWKLHLFQNNYTPTKSFGLADLVECDAPGYAPIELDPANWSDPATVGDAGQSWYGSAFSQFTASSGSQVQYGYFITFDDGAEALLAERFDATQTLTSATPVQVWPVLTSQSASEPLP